MALQAQHAPSGCNQTIIVALREAQPDKLVEERIPSSLLHTELAHHSEVGAENEPIAAKTLAPPSPPKGAASV